MGEYRHTIKTTCKFCRMDFDSFGLTKICPDCDTNMDKYFFEIKAYLEEFPNATVAEICSDLDISLELIRYYLKEKRLEVKNKGRNHITRCEKCNKTITKGKYCHECEILIIRAEMESKLIHNSKTEKETAKFHSRKHTKR